MQPCPERFADLRSMVSKSLEQCARCGTRFVCKPEAIHACACTTVELSAAQRQHIAARYFGCLCPVCLEEVSKQPTPVRQ